MNTRMGDSTEGIGKEKVSHKDLERCECETKSVESVSYSLPDESYVSMTRCSSCKGLTDWTIRKHESSFDYKFGEDLDKEPEDKEEQSPEPETKSNFSNFVSFFERETIAVLIIGLGVTVFALQWGLTLVTGLMALASFLGILPLLYYTDREN